MYSSIAFRATLFVGENLSKFPTDSNTPNNRRKSLLLRSKRPVARTLGHLSDHELVRRCILYHNAAWQEVIRRHGATIYAAITRQLGWSLPSRNGVEAEDIVGKVFEKLLERDCMVLKNLRDPGVIRAYLCQIARTVTVDYLRDELTARVVTSSHDLGRTFAEPSEIAMVKEKHRMLEKALEKLPERHRVLLKLYYEEGLKYREIAELTGTPIKTVGTILHRARNAARELLKKRETSFPWKANS